MAACSSPAAVEPPPTTNAAGCDDFMAALPEEIVGQSPRETDPRSALTAAWGDPAIIVRCGVPDPEALTITSKLVTVNGVDWFPEELTKGYLFTTFDRAVNVEVTVPDDYAPEAGALTELSTAVAANVPPAR